jgi:hypothetical protein
VDNRRPSEQAARALLEAVRAELLRRYGSLDLYLGVIWGRNDSQIRRADTRYPN